MIGVITAPTFALPGIRHGYFTREGGVSGGLYTSLNGGQGSDDDPASVAENRARMAAYLGVAAANLVSAYQVHSPDVAIVTAPWAREDRPKVDALVTDRPGLALGVSTADCGPLLFADPDARVIGAAHAGWKGAFTGIIEATIAAMERLGARRERLTVALGMMISRAAYEVGPEFVARFSEADRRFFTPSGRENHAMFDLPGYIRMRVGAAGISRFEDVGLCTYADERRFFSYRRSTHRKEADYGRHISAITLEG
jgi:polyphenol oxidase